MVDPSVRRLRRPVAGRLISVRGAIALRLKICHNILDLSPREGILLMRGNVPVFVARSDSRHIPFQCMDETTLSVFVDESGCGGRGSGTNDTVKRYSRGGL